MKPRHTVVDGLELALGFTVVLDANGAASSGRVGGHCGGFVRVEIIKKVGAWEWDVEWELREGSEGFFYAMLYSTTSN